MANPAALLLGELVSGLVQRSTSQQSSTPARTGDAEEGGSSDDDPWEQDKLTTLARKTSHRTIKSLTLPQEIPSVESE